MQAVANVVMLAGKLGGATIDANAALRDVMTRAYLDPAFGSALLQRDVTPAQKASFMSKAQVMLGIVSGENAADRQAGQTQ